MRSTFLDAADTCRALLDHPDLERRWDEPSPLRGLTLGALSAHLARAVTLVDTYLGRPGQGEPVDPPGYYLGLTGIRAPSDDDPLATGVRQRAESAAAAGLTQVRVQWDRARRRAETRLAETPAGALIEVFESTMSVDDYLVTRLVELLVHADDLAVGLGVPTPVFSFPAYAAVLDCLWEVARRRSEPMALIRAMTRVERDVGQALRVL